MLPQSAVLRARDAGGPATPVAHLFRRARMLAAASLGGLLSFAGVSYFGAREAAAEPVRILVAASSKQGLAAERPLKFADNDAARVRDVLVNLGGVSATDAIVVREPSRTELFAAIDRAKEVARAHRTSEVTLVFYFSGHGDREAIHLAGDRVLVSDLSAKLAEVPAGLRIAVTDACRATRDKGFSDDAPFAISATLVPQATGQVWLHASSDGEAAQESDELQGAIFTHAWLNGLRGAADTNGDARVTLDESFAFAHSQTLIRSAKSSGVLQKPEAIVNLRETAPVVLTQTASATKIATLSLPVARDTHFLVYASGSKSVLSEIWGSPDRRLVLRVPPGRYVVQRRAASVGAAATIAMAEGEERRLEDKDFVTGSLELVARKGEDGVEPDRVPTAPSPIAHHEISAGYDLGMSGRTGFVHGPRATYAYDFGRVALAIGGGADFSSRSLEASDERLVSGYGRAGAELRVPVSGLTLRLGGGARAGVLAQSVERTATSVTVPAEGSKTGFFFGPEAVAAVRAGVGRSLFVDLSATGSVLFVREETSLRGIGGITGALGAGAKF